MSRRAAPPQVLFLGSMFAGWRTRFLDLRSHTQRDPRIEGTYRGVTGWRDDGLIERATFLPRGVRGLARTTLEASALARIPRPDAIWTSVYSGVAPFLWAQRAPFRRPLVLELDDTVASRDEDAEFYWHRPPHRGFRRSLVVAQERALFRSVTLFAPLSEWTADSLRAAGVDDSRIRVNPPGIDVDVWTPPAAPRMRAPGAPLRLVFVGTDFVRKGGDLLLEAIRGPLRGRAELDIVTSPSNPIDVAPDIRVHHPGMQHNSPLIRDLYARADLFVMPSRAEHFGFATIEAMASGLPVLIGAVGAGPAIVGDGSVGWTVTPTLEGVIGGLERAVARADDLPAMGRAARLVAERRYSATTNFKRTVDLVLEAIELERSGHLAPLGPVRGA